MLLRFRVGRPGQSRRERPSLVHRQPGSGRSVALLDPRRSVCPSLRERDLLLARRSGPAHARGVRAGLSRVLETRFL